MKLLKNPEVEKVYASYPAPMRKKLKVLRSLILETAKGTEGIDFLEETLKWGEPSYICKGGSTIRIAWSAKKPEQYALYVHCQTKLIDTFQEIYKSQFNFEGNRAIIFDKNEAPALKELEYCIFLALTYQQRKHLPLLGAN